MSNYALNDIRIARRTLLLALPAGAFASAPSGQMNAQAIAKLLLDALKLQPGERVVIPRDSDYFGDLVMELERGVKAAGAEPIVIDWSPKGKPRPGAPIREMLEAAQVFLWLPFRTAEREVTPAETQDIARWTDLGGARRQIHFHWDQGSVEADGLPGQHTANLDALYGEALKVDYRAMAAKQAAAMKLLTNGPVRVTTLDGTDIRFELRDRPFNRQDGDASASRMESAKVRVDREIEYPAGVLRVAPIEETAQGTMVIPEARFEGKVVKGLRLIIKDGKADQMIASDGLAAVQNGLMNAGDAALRFREFGLGFNPKLRPLPKSRIMPYFGYGAGVVRLSLGDNEELGGSIRGAFRRWFFFPNATVVAAKRTLVRNGRLVI
jgi:hypothetical protein